MLRCLSHFARTNLTTLRQPTAPACIRRFSSAAPDAADSNRFRQRQKNAQEIDELKSVEAQLFENGIRNNRPVDAAELLNRYTAKPPKAKRHKSQQRSFAKPKPPPAEPKPYRQPPTVAPPHTNSEVIRNEHLDLAYTKLHPNDRWLGSLLMTVKSRKSRAHKHQLLIEGRRLIVEALASGLQLEHVLFSDIAQLQLLRAHLPAERVGSRSAPEHERFLVKVPQSDLLVWSNLSTCPGLMAVFTKPHDMDAIWSRADQQARRSAALPITVVCDQIREPNNLGAIIRNCAAAGCAQVIVTKGCADPWESKALRGGAGAQFQLPVRGPCEWDSVSSMLPENDAFVYLAENNERTASQRLPADGGRALTEYSAMRYAAHGRHSVLVIGGETHGLSADAYRLMRRSVMGGCVRIPLAAHVDSLNAGAALAVILFEMRRQWTEFLRAAAK